MSNQNPDVGATELRNCQKCIHFRKSPSADLQLQGVGICTCHPPQVNMQVDRRGNMHVGTAFPMVNHQIVCGQFRPHIMIAPGGGDGS